MVTKKMYKQISSVHGSSVLTVTDWVKNLAVVEEEVWKFKL